MGDTATLFPIDTGSGSPVVLVHGQPGAARDWDRLVEVLAEAHRVLVPDRLGWGVNDGPVVGIAENAAWLDAALEEALGPEQLLVVGHSFGGGVSLSLALDHPARVRALVLVGSVGRSEALSPLDRALARPILGEGIVRGGLAAGVRVGRFIRRRSARGTGRDGTAAPADVVALLEALGGDEPITERQWRGFLVEQQALVSETPALQARLSTLAVPTAVVAGTRDHVIPVAASRALAASIPGAELVLVEGAGHLLPMRATRQLASVIERYDKLSLPASPAATVRQDQTAPPPDGTGSRAVRLMGSARRPAPSS